MNVYIAGADWHIVPDFNAPEGFHAAERVWYIGAQDCPGEVFISEPYLDANGGGMCFTVSTLLSDGETVVGMDLNFSEAQQSILRMTQGRGQTAMIVTSGGLIAGYTDMSLVIVLAFCIRISTNWGTSRMNREADAYENQLNEWVTEQKSVLNMFTDVISSQPALLDDYESAVHWLAEVSGNYSNISLCYLANPYNEHPVIMSNGWEPGEDYRPETRLWYRATERSADGFSISAPYLDAQSGTYCITLSRMVYGRDGAFLCIFGIDFFLDKLIQVLGESYTSHGYAFLVDSDGVIINHPSGAYQMGEDRQTSVEDTEYADACSRDGVTVLRDYAPQLIACLSRKTGSGFTVVVANRWWDIYGSVVIVTLVFLALFGACLGFIVSLINRLIRWQAQTNRQLVASADEAQSANRAKSQFLSQMSHEIRTPMNAIIGLNSIVLRDESIFEAFSQEDTRTTNRYGGSGLGMAITKSIVDMMGGEIHVESEKGRGSTFTVTVTLGRVRPSDLPEAPAGSAEAAAQSVALEGRRVLVAEDQAMNAEILMDLLEMEGVASEWAEDGKRATEMFEQSAAGYYDAILMDMRMPVMDGLAASRSIREMDRPDAATVPIIALTANAFEEDVNQCLQAGMNAHLSKPVDMDLLKKTLSGLLPAKP